MNSLNRTARRTIGRPANHASPAHRFRHGRHACRPAFRLRENGGTGAGSRRGGTRATRRLRCGRSNSMKRTAYRSLLPPNANQVNGVQRAVPASIATASGGPLRPRRTSGPLFDPIDPGAITRLYQLTCDHKWEVFFITQRPVTAGGTVQRQTHTVARRAWISDAQRDSAVCQSRKGGIGAATRLPGRRHAAELRRRPVRLIDARHPARRSGRSARRTERASSRDRYRAQHSARPWICLFKRPKRARIPRCSKSSENSPAGSRTVAVQIFV